MDERGRKLHSPGETHIRPRREDSLAKRRSDSGRVHPLIEPKREGLRLSHGEDVEGTVP